LARRIHGLGKGLKERFCHVVRFLPVQQFQVQITPRFVGKSLEKLPRQTEPKLHCHIAFDGLKRHPIQPPPHQHRPATEINDAPGQTFIHRHVGLAT
jgi:hypothetical protein